MAWNLAAPSSLLRPAPAPHQQPPFRKPTPLHPRGCFRRKSGKSSGRRRTAVAAALREEVAGGTSDDGGDGSRLSSARSRLDLLEQLTSCSDDESDGDSYKLTIREQLAELVEGRLGDFSIPLGKKLKKSVASLTTSQRRNIKRQSYLNEVSRRNDSRFFAVIGAFVILPPIVILAVAILTGYVQLFP